MYDMIFGGHASGFGWDPVKQCVVAENSVWEEYVKTHKDAAKFRNKSFPYFDQLCTIYGKDRATGREANNDEDYVEEFDATNNEPQAEEIDEEGEFRLDTDPIEQVTEQVVDQPLNNATESSKSKKRKRNTRDRDDIVVDALKEMVATMGSHMQVVAEKLIRNENLDAQRAALFSEMTKLEGITPQERRVAFRKIIADEALLVAFGSLPDEEKVELIRDLLL